VRVGKNDPGWGVIMDDVAHSVGGGGPAPDEAGFREWMLVRSSTLRRKAYLLCGDWSSADDLVQDVLVAMYPRWPRIVRGGHVDAYANRVLVGKHVDTRRRPWRRERPVHTVPDAIDPESERAIAAIDEHDGPLMTALATLPPGQRAVLVLRFTDGLSIEEIATVMGIPNGTVKSRLSRGTDSLRAQLGLSDSPSTRQEPVRPHSTFAPATKDRS
jgi:RNA polymerase sigma-70 factor (sigma-E family)